MPSGDFSTIGLIVKVLFLHLHKIVSMIRKYHNHKPQTTPWHRKLFSWASYLNFILSILLRYFNVHVNSEGSGDIVQIHMFVSKLTGHLIDLCWYQNLETDLNIEDTCFYNGHHFVQIFSDSPCPGMHIWRSSNFCHYSVYLS